MVNFALSDLDRRLGSDTIFGGHVYAVGGRVRDHFINEIHGTSYASKDADYVIVGLSLEEVQRRLGGVGRIDEVGASFPTLKLTIDGEQVDVALARRERSTGVGHSDFAVEFGPEVTIELDAIRRDFRMNMLSVRCSDGVVNDPAGGLDDIRARRVSLVTQQAFIDDPLRMERAVQFASRFEFTIEDQTYAEIKRASHLIASCSAERHKEELDKLVGKSARPSRGFELLRETGLLVHIVPELLEGVGVAQNVFHDKDVWGHNLAALDVAASAGGDLVDRYAAVFHDVAKPRTVGVRSDGQGSSFHGHEDLGAEMVGEIFARLRFPHEMSRTIAGLTRNHMYVCRTSDGKELSDGAIRRFITKIRDFSHPDATPEAVRENIDRQFLLRNADRIGGRAGAMLADRDEENAEFQARVYAELEREPAVSVKHLAIDGRDVIDVFIESGARPPTWRGDVYVGETLKWALNAVLDSPELNTREDLLKLAAVFAEMVKTTDQKVAMALDEELTIELGERYGRFRESADLPSGRRTGEIVGVTREFVYQDAGRGALLRYPTELCISVPLAGAVVAMTLEPDGRVVVTPAIRDGIENEVVR